MEDTKRIELRVYPGRIRKNIRTITDRLPKDVKVCMVVKADAYGHGALEVARRVRDLVDFFAVATPYEAIELKDAGITQPVLVLGYVWPEALPELIRREVRINIFREEDALYVSEAALSLGKTAFIHFSVNTGMNRLGFPFTDEAAETMARISCLPGIKAEGLFTHFAKADSEILDDTTIQLNRFRRMKLWLEEKGVTIELYHAANSAASMVLPGAAYDMVRLGIAAYGLYPSDEMDHSLQLCPAMELKSRVTRVSGIGPGEGVGYGYAYVAPEPRTLAVVPVGYADGYPRLLSNRADVLIHGRRAPIRGRVCMDQMMVDITGIPGVKPGDEVTLLGRDGPEEITAEELERLSGVLRYEIVCGLARTRVPRKYYDEEE